MDKTTKVYVLYDMTVNPPAIRYVGKTISSSLEQYFKNKHIGNANRSGTIGQRHVCRWLRKINFQARIQGIGVYPTEELGFAAEKHFIKFFRDSGCDLTNLTDGGEGVSGFKSSKESIDKRKKSVRQWHLKHPGELAGWHHKIEAKEKISKNNARYWKGKTLPRHVLEKSKIALKGRIQSVEEIAHRTNGLLDFYKTHDGPTKGTTWTPERTIKQSIVMLGKNKGKKRTKECIEENKLRGINRFKAIEARKMHSNTMKEYYKTHKHPMVGRSHSEETKRNISEKILAIQANPEIREKNRQAHLGKKRSKESIQKAVEVQRKNREDKYLATTSYGKHSLTSFSYPCAALHV